MPKLIINDKSNIRQNISMNFFLDDEIITFKGIKKEIEYVDYGEHTIKASTLFVKSLEQKINIEKEVTEIEIRFNWKIWLFDLIFWLSITILLFKTLNGETATSKFLFSALTLGVLGNLCLIIGKPLVLKVKEQIKY